MAREGLIEEVGKYIDRYYKPGNDDVKTDKEIQSIFDRIASFGRKRKKEKEH